MNRRQFNAAALMASGAALFSGACFRVEDFKPVAQSPLSLPTPESSGVDHIVAVTMENRSFDHLFGWMPNADGMQAGLTYLDHNGVVHPTYSLSGNYTGCPGTDPDHTYEGARITYDGGKMDGFLLDTVNDELCIGYYGANDIPFYAALARNYTTCDRYFASILGPTVPNRLFIHAAQTDRLADTGGITTLPTIWDRLAAANVSRAYYYNNLPFLTSWGTKYQDIMKPWSQFQSDAADGSLPSVAFVDPLFTVLDDGSGNDDHPHADIRKGETFLHDVFQAVSTGPGWSSTVLIINFDEWGGFFEHVPPPRAQAANNVDTDIINGKTLLGMRIPAVIASPWTAGNPDNPTVNSMVFDHTSVLKLIEWRWGLEPLTPRDASSDINNLAYALNFSHPQTAVPALPNTQSPSVVTVCPQNPSGDGARPAVALQSGTRSAGGKASEFWRELRWMAQNNGIYLR